MNWKNVALQSIVTLIVWIPSALGLNCYACLPDLSGGSVSREVSLLWVANISRTWSERRQSSFGYCSAWSQEPMFQVTCPNYGANTACISGIRTAIGGKSMDWEAMTCGVLTANGTGCFIDSNRVKVCYCTTDYCNDASLLKHSAMIMTLVMGIHFTVIFNRH